MKFKVLAAIFFAVFFISGCGASDTIENRGISVNFHFMDGSEVESIEVEQDNNIPFIEATRIGYLFEGWYTSYDNGVTLEFQWDFIKDTVISNDVDLYAKWTPNEYIVSLNQNWGEFITSEISVTFDTNMPYQAIPTRDGYIFEGYYDDLGNMYYDSEMNSARTWDKAENSILFALWADLAEIEPMFSIENNENKFGEYVKLNVNVEEYVQGRLVPDGGIMKEGDITKVEIEIPILINEHYQFNPKLFVFIYDLQIGGNSTYSNLINIDMNIPEIVKNSSETAVFSISMIEPSNQEEYDALMDGITFKSIFSVVFSHGQSVGNNEFSFSDLEFEYDGSEKTTTIDFISSISLDVIYENNTGINVYDYIATAKIKFDDDLLFELNSILSIVPGELEGNFDMNDKNVVYDSSLHCIFIESELPDELNTTYYIDGEPGNCASEVGVYDITVIIEGDNYNPLEVNATLTIEEPKEHLTGLAESIVSSLILYPNLWNSIPESMLPENNVQAQANELNYEDFISVDSLPTEYFSSQLVEVLGTIDNAQEILSNLSFLQSASVTIIDLYQAFIDENPSDYNVFESEYNYLDFKISLSEDLYGMFIRNNQSGIEISLYRDLVENVNIGRIEVLGSSSLRYEDSGVETHVAFNVFGLYLKEIKILRLPTLTNIEINNFIGAADNYLQTTIVAEINDEYLSIVSSDTGTSLPGQNVEIYSIETGEFLISKVREMSAINFNTYKYRLDNFAIGDFDNIKFEDTKVYVNNSSSEFDEPSVSMMNSSRRFYIELRDVWVFILDSGNNIEKVKLSLPFIFVQENYIDTYEEEVYTNNSDNGISSIIENKMEENFQTKVSNIYEVKIVYYYNVKSNSSYEDIIEFVGDRNAYFED